MGLTIHYHLKSDAAGPEWARQQMEQLRQAALDLALLEKDQLGRDIVATITEYPNFEHLEAADGRKNEERDSHP